MKKTISIFFLTIIFNVGFAQNLTQKIANIRSEVEKINNRSTYKVRTLNNEEFLDEMPDGGGELKAYYENGELVKMVDKIYLSSCINITEYYIKNKRLIFAYSQGKEWFYNEKNNKFDPKRICLKMECRFYYENSKLIKSILNGRTRCSGEPNVAWAKNYIDNFNGYQKKLRSK